ncbi:mitochondrial 37S ribosomal uS13m domain-containing protein [Kwoniella pini CBS 10737]|uniref:Small ribosomal subunit protein uS13m n=1 Tax=Kwoniella pini CBS 10737 TaxID=1296096 RepID=A0A1B9I2T6_9TREE|nr:30S small subunit ribosomal protein S13 [Kwoniella pini CBS 10737]OCF49778.1 30S small subunit ribosomal protein S13 [Kwoniella pini CBS 10737]
MHLLGHNLPDHKPLKIALLTFYGLSHTLSSRLLARLSIHSEALVSDLTEPQLTSLSAYLSSPSTTLKSQKDSLIKLSPPGGRILSLPNNHNNKFNFELNNNSNNANLNLKGKGKEDPLDELLLETEARRSMQSDIAHLRMVGTYRGKRHAAGYPVRGQRTQTNASTAKKHNRVERRGFTTSVIRPSFGITQIPSPPSRILRELSRIA